MPRLSKFIVETSLSESDNRVLIYSTFSGQICILPKDTVQLIKNRSYDFSNDDILIEDLLRKRILVQDDSDELSDLLLDNARLSDENSTLYFVIQPSSYCQFSCSYCGQKHNKGSASISLPAEIGKFVDKAIRTRPTRNVRVGWFGAEPLAGFRTMLDVSHEIRQVVQHRNIAFTSKIVTNGYSLTMNVVSRLMEAAGLDEIEVTIDGPKHIHDARRAPSNNRGSYERILNNIHNLTGFGIAITIRCNVDLYNYKYVDVLISDLTSRGLNRFCKLYFAPVHSWGNDAHDTSISREIFAYKELSWKLQLHKLGWDVGFLPPRKSNTCLATKDDGYVFDSNGTAFGCTEFPLVDQYKGRELGALLGPAGLRKDRLSNFWDRVLEGDTYCKNCFNLPTCGGACPKEWDEGRVPCPSFKYAAEDALRCAIIAAKLSGERNL